MYVRIATDFLPPQLFANGIYAVTTRQIKESYVTKQGVTVGPALELSLENSEARGGGGPELGRSDLLESGITTDCLKPLA